MIIVLLIISLLASPALATTYYVATTGSDSTGDGSVGNPWREPNKCYSAGTPIVSGDTCLVKNGTYTDTDGNGITVSIGSAGAGTTFKAENYLGAIIQLNQTLNGNRTGIRVTGSNVTVEGFDITDQNTATAGASVTMSGLTFVASGGVARRNSIHNIGRAMCTDSLFGISAMFVDSVSDTIVENNLIYTIGRKRNGEAGCTKGDDQHDHGIYASATTRLTIRHNVFYDTNRGYAIHVFKSSSTTNDIAIYNNTIGGKSPTGRPFAPILLANTIVGCNIKNNVVQDVTISFITTFSLTVSSSKPCTVSFNRMNTNESDGSENFFNGSTPTNVTSSNNTDNSAIGFTSVSCTQSDGGCENHDFTLASGANAINAGTDVGLAYNGAAPDQGAFETFVFSSCQVPNGAASTIQITFTNNVNPPIGSTITTFTARKNGASNALTGAASMIGDNIASLPLTNSYAGGDTADISWASGGLTDSAKIGGTLNQPFIQTLTNQSCTNNAGGAPTFTFTQSRFEFHDHYGSESSPVVLPYGYASSGAAENFSSLKVATSGSLRIRFAIVCGTSNCDPTGFHLYYSTGGAYAVIPDAFDVGNVKFCGVPSDVNTPTNGAATTDQLSTAGTFIAGGVVFTSNAIPTISGLNTNFKTELEYCVAFDSDATGNYDFRVYKQSGTALDTYTVTPRVVLQPTAAGGSGF